MPPRPQTHGVDPKQSYQSQNGAKRCRSLCHLATLGQTGAPSKPVAGPLPLSTRKTNNGVKQYLLFKNVGYQIHFREPVQPYFLSRQAAWRFGPVRGKCRFFPPHNHSRQIEKSWALLRSGCGSPVCCVANTWDSLCPCLIPLFPSPQQGLLTFIFRRNFLIGSTR